MSKHEVKNPGKYRTPWYKPMQTVRLPDGDMLPVGLHYSNGFVMGLSLDHRGAGYVPYWRLEE